MCKEQFTFLVLMVSSDFSLQVSVCEYEEIHFTNVHPDHSLVLPASGEHHDSVYALAQDVSSNNLHYSTIKFTDHSDRSSPDGQTTCDYSTVVL